MPHYDNARKAMSGLDRIAQTIALPNENRPLRLPSFPNLERTSVLSFNQTRSWNVGVTTSGPDRFEGHMAVLTNQPACPLFLNEIPYDDAGLLPANSYVEFRSAAASTLETFSATGDSFEVDSSVYVAMTPSGTRVGHAARWPIGQKDNNWFMFSPYNTTKEFVMSFTANVANTYRIHVEYLSPTGEPKMTFLTGVAGGTSLTISVSMPGGATWWRVSSIEVSTYVGTVSLEQISMRTVFPTTEVLTFVPAFGVPEAANSALPWINTRANATGCLFTNVSAVMQKEGTIQGARLPARLLNPFSNWRLNTAFTACHPQEKYFGAAEKGCYTFMLPDAPGGEFRNTIFRTASTNDPDSPIFNLDSDSYMNLLSFTDFHEDSGAVDSVFAITLAQHIEFRNNSMLFGLGYSATPLESYHMAQMALVRQGVFYENPLHWGIIASMVGKAVRALAPTVMPYAISATKAIGDRLLSNMAKKSDMSQKQMVLPRGRDRNRQAKKKRSVVKRGGKK